MLCAFIKYSLYQRLIYFNKRFCSKNIVVFIVSSFIETLSNENGLLYQEMGNIESRGNSTKRNKNHNRQKMFRIGVSCGRNDLNVEGHLQMGYNSKTIKNYAPIPPTVDMTEDSKTTSAVVKVNDRTVDEEESIKRSSETHS